MYLLEVSKFSRNPGPAPNRHSTKLDGLSIEPGIHIRARRYILLALGCSFRAQHEPISWRSGNAKVLPGLILGPAPGPPGLELDISSTCPAVASPLIFGSECVGGWGRGCRIYDLKTYQQVM